MKKILSLFLLLFMVSFAGIIDVEALKITIDSVDKVALNKKIDVTFTISEYNGVPGNMTIDYPSNLLQCNTNCPREVNITENKSFTYQFNAIGNGKATISVLSNYSGADTSKEIIVGTTTTKALPTTTTTTVATTTEAPKSNNANLKTLTIKGNDGSDVVLSPSFDPSVYEYSATVLSTVKTVQIDATMEDSKSNMVISNNASEELIAGENNKITITVTAEDGTKKAYTLNIKREALTSDATLKELTIEEVPSFKLEENVFEYTIEIEEDVKRLTLNYILSEENSTIEIDGNEDLKDGSKVKIIVTAEDGTKKEYTLNVSKETEVTKAVVADIPAEKNPLIIMALSIVAFGLIGGIIYVIKK